MSSSSEDMNLNGDLSVNNLTVRGTCTGCGGGGGGPVPLAHFFTNVAVTGVLNAPLVGLVVPTTAPIVIPVGWRCIVQAFASVEGAAPGFPSAHPQIPGPFPLGAPASGGGIGVLTIRQDPGPNQIIWSGKATPVFAPFVNSATQPTGYIATMPLVSRGFFVSDGLPHTYEVEIGIPPWFTVAWFTETDAFDIGLGTPIPGLGLSIFAYPP